MTRDPSGNVGRHREPIKNRRSSYCALCDDRVDLRDEHYRLMSEFRVRRAVVHVECYRKLQRVAPSSSESESQ